jgi:glycogen debranching enzyme
MARNIAILGDYDRGYEVISILASLGGKNPHDLEGTHNGRYYYIDDSNSIICQPRESMEVTEYEFHNIDTYYVEYGKNDVIMGEFDYSVLCQFEEAYNTINTFAKTHKGIIDDSILVSMDTIKHKLNEISKKLEKNLDN